MRFRPSNCPDLWAYIDDKYAWLLQYTWWYDNSSGYVQGTYKGRTRRLHRVIAELEGWSAKKQVDHKNRNRLDNRLTNIRSATHTQNTRNRPKQRNNTSGYKGVTRHGKGWKATIWINTKRHHLGTYPTPQQAARAYNESASLHFGEFAYLNAV